MAGLLWIPSIAQSQTVPQTVVQTAQVRAELQAYAPQGVQAGQPLWLGLQLQHQPGWHTYWRNPGDSGLATQLQWQLPKGLTVGDTVWPTPHMIPVGNMVNHGYEGRVLLAAPVTVGSGLTGREVEIRLQADWLVCKEECIPQSGQFVLKLPVASSLAEHGEAFEQLFAMQPVRISPAKQPMSFDADALSLRIQGLPAELQGKPVKAYAHEPEVLASGLGMSGGGEWHNGEWRVRAALHNMRSTEPTALDLLLVDDSNTPARSWQVTLQIQGEWPKPKIAATQSAVTTAPTAAADAWPGLISALVGALIGGLLLNLMPCVLPVLAIKVLSLTQSTLTPFQRKGMGSAYALGVLSSMLALALLVMGLRAAGAQLGWGFQLQSPGLVAGLALLFTLIALNLWGLLEWRGAWVSGLAAQMVRHPLMDAFLSGVLAVVVAAPCTAPFMGASVGVAFTLPAWQGLLIFLSLGMGLALPFTLSAWIPATAHWLPKPGAWMQVLRQSLAFPMLLTVVWLLWVFSKQAGEEAAALLLAGLVLAGGLVWSLAVSKPAGQWVRAVFIACLCGLLGLAQPVLQSNSSATANTSVSEGWQAWSPERVNQAMQDKQAVFIDFTAAWCVTCQVNKQTTLRDPRVLKAFADRQVLLLRADWTRQDPVISQALNELGRSGVPVYVLQAPGQPPQVLSELLSPDLVIRALEAIPR
ncbi:MAG: protein-disulfide reductase DsbD family protein [Limnohabitans sp.]